MQKIKDILERVLAISKGKAGDIAFYASFAFYFAFRFYQTTMFISLVEKPLWLLIPSYLGFLVLGILSVIAFFDELQNSRSDAIVIALLLIIGAGSLLTTGLKDPLAIYCIIIAVKDRDIKQAVLLYVIIGSVIMVAAYYASMNGYIPYLVYDKGSNSELLAHAFGMCYRTDLGAHVLFLVMGYALIRGERLHLWEYMMLWFDTWIVWRYTAARTGTACLVLFLTALGGILLYYRIRKEWIPVLRIFTLTHILCAAAILFVILFYPETHLSSIDLENSASSLASRISLSRKAMEMYPVNIFGNFLDERGAGGIVDTSKSYFYIDISYVRILLEEGLAGLVAYIALMTRASHNARKKKQPILALALVVLAVDSMVEHHAFSIAYNFLMMAVFGYMGSIAVKKENDMIPESKEGS